MDVVIFRLPTVLPTRKNFWYPLTEVAALRQTPTHTKCIIVETIYEIFGPYPLADLDVDGKPILKCVVQEGLRRFENWVDQGKDGEGRRKRCEGNSPDPGQKWVADCCEYGNEPLDPPKERNFLKKRASVSRQTHKQFTQCYNTDWHVLTLILRRSRTGTVWFYTSTSNKRAARPKLYTKSLTRDLKLMYSRFTLVRISINLQAPRFFYIGTGVLLLFRERFLYI